MKKREMTISEFAKSGGDALKEKKKGTDYYSQISKKGREALRERDPEYYVKLAKSGLHAREVKRQAWIEANIKDMSSSTDKLTRILTGRG